MEHQQDAAVGSFDFLAKRLVESVDSPPFPSEFHGHGQWIVGVSEVVTQDAIEGTGLADSPSKDRQCGKFDWCIVSDGRTGFAEQKLKRRLLRRGDSSLCDNFDYSIVQVAVQGSFRNWEVEMRHVFKFGFVVALTACFTMIGCGSSSDSSGNRYPCLTECSVGDGSSCTNYESCTEIYDPQTETSDSRCIPDEGEFTEDEIQKKYDCLATCSTLGSECKTNQNCTIATGGEGVCAPVFYPCPSGQTVTTNHGCRPECTPTTDGCGPDEFCRSVPFSEQGGACVPSCRSDEILVTGHGCLKTCNPNSPACGSNATCQRLQGGGGACLPDDG